MRFIEAERLVEELSERIGGKRTLVCGVGNDLRADDGVGVRVAGKLGGLKLRDGVSVISCGELPENYLQDIVEFDPECVVILDATNVGGDPGSIVIVENAEISSHTISTHRLPLSFLSKIIESRMSHEVDIFILGIQIGSYEFGEELTPEVTRSSDILTSSLASVLGD